MTEFNPQYKTLDHWRGVAVLGVMVFHGFGALRGAGQEPHPTLAWLKNLSDYGWFGVHLFFVISGYCIAANVYRLTASGRGPWDFIRDRLLRIYPVYWAACALAVAVGLAALPFNRGSLTNTLPLSFKALLANTLLLEPHVQVDPLLLVSWSLVYEIGFYLLVALGLALGLAGVNRWLLFGLAIALAIAGLLGVHSGPLYVLKYWPEFLCGSAVFLALWMRERHRLWGVFLALPLVFTLVALLGQNDPLYVVQITGAALFALFLWTLHPYDQSLAGRAELRWLANVGVISYSLYLVHVPLQGRVINFLSRFVSHDDFGYVFTQVAGWSVALAAAAIFYKVCEQPLNRWRRLRPAVRSRPVIVAQSTTTSVR